MGLSAEILKSFSRRPVPRLHAPFVDFV